MKVPATICISFATLMFYSSMSGYAGQLENAGGLVGKAAPAFRMMDISGTEIVTDVLYRNGKVTLVNFWGLRCSACVEEIPYLNRIYEEFTGKINMIGVNVDGVAGDLLADQMKKVRIRIVYTVLPDPELKVSDSFKMEGAPLTVIIDTGGIVRYVHENFSPGDEKEITNIIDALLVTKRPSS